MNSTNPPTYYHYHNNSNSLEMSPDLFIDSIPEIELIFEDENTKRKRGRPPSKKPTSCAICGVKDTPEWRKGPDNLPVCNACGLQFAKQSKREKQCKVKCAIPNILNDNESGAHDPMGSVIQYFLDCNGSPIVFGFIPKG
ncbi:hypothetical protein DLAC_00217 [Tieghemostelium lacteum]|uniref:GATA-type domain-containing protein n=1 Tax=Tieghemostelium lacteum TaxID=361077 RepID=A0A152A964_TIELA|nr:hypothetical protein DLAC_00217 [Tieghemostelium lacteum]|eukprot:KYR02754.1 hypothetical protein DLAC_00217 [Tieghemostelium lacteum]